jgi:hypothetical protein
MQSSERVAAVQARNRVDLYYGSRKSDKFVRCYEKIEVGAYRVELELHSGLLRRHNISALNDLARLPELVYPKHFDIVDFDWDHLRQYLVNKIGGRSDAVIAGARQRRTSILRLQRYLRRKGVFNTHRYLVPRAINGGIIRALKRWARTFDSEESWADTK